MRSHRLVPDLGYCLIRQDVFRFPTGSELGEPGLYRIHVRVFWARLGEGASRLGAFAWASGLGEGVALVAVDDAVEAVSHASCLRFRGEVSLRGAVAAGWVGAHCDAALDRCGGVFACLIDELEAACPCGFVWQETDAIVLGGGRQAPCRRKRDLSTAGWATDRAPPQVRLGIPVGARGLKIFIFGIFVFERRHIWIDSIHQRFDAVAEAFAHALVFFEEVVSILLRPLAGGVEDDVGDWVELVGVGAQSESSRLEWDGAAARGHIEDDRVLYCEVVTEPRAFIVSKVVRECALVVVLAVGVAGVDIDGGLEGDAVRLGGGDARLVANDLRVRSHGCHEAFVVGVRWQEAGRHGCAAHGEWPACPPDVQPVDGRQRGGCVPFAYCFDGDFVDG